MNKTQIKNIVKSSLANVRLWYEIKYNGGYPTIAEILYFRNNEGLLEFMNDLNDYYYKVDLGVLTTEQIYSALNSLRKQYCEVDIYEIGY